GVFRRQGAAHLAFCDRRGADCPAGWSRSRVSNTPPHALRFQSRICGWDDPRNHARVGLRHPVSPGRAQAPAGPGDRQMIDSTESIPRAAGKNELLIGCGSRDEWLVMIGLTYERLGLGA